MKRSTWLQLLKLEHEFEKRGEVFSRPKIQDAMKVSAGQARLYDAFLKAKEIIRSEDREQTFDGQRVGVLTDIHIPFQDNVAVEAALAYLDEFRPDTLVLLGDVMDFYKLSRFMKKVGRKSVKQELKQCAAFLRMLRERFPKAEMIYKEGNHEMHMERYILENAPEIADLVDDLLISKLCLHELDIDYRVNFFSIGKLWYLHGDEKTGGGMAEYVTNVTFRQTLDHTIFGHHHRVQEKVFKRIDGSTLWCGSVGYLAGPLEYARLNQWSQGFATIVYQGNGHFKARLHKIQNGIIY